MPSQPPSLRPTSSTPPLQCLVFAAQLAGAVRGRGSAAQLEERRPTVEKLHKLVETVARLAGERKSFEVLAW